MIIDTRLRPPTPEFVRIMVEGPMTSTYFRKLKKIFPPRPIEEFLPEIDEAGITKAVLVGKSDQSTTRVSVPHEHIADLARRYPGRFIGIAGIDPTVGTCGEVLQEVEMVVRELGMAGISLDLLATDVKYTDKRLYPIYAKCEELGAVVYITTGYLMGRASLDTGAPAAINEIATDFPNLKIACPHACWPWVHEFMSVIMRSSVLGGGNVYCLLDVNRPWLPGSELYVQYANQFPDIADHILFGTGYPLSFWNPDGTPEALPPRVERFRKLPFKPDVMEKVLYKNAVRLFGL
ncbi:MAG: amidohydrolase family protein [Dehalococcoidia bacterium]